MCIFFNDLKRPKQGAELQITGLQCQHQPRISTNKRKINIINKLLPTIKAPTQKALKMDSNMVF